MIGTTGRARRGEVSSDRQTTHHVVRADNLLSLWRVLDPRRTELRERHGFTLEVDGVIPSAVPVRHILDLVVGITHPLLPAILPSDANAVGTRLTGSRVEDAMIAG